VSTTVRVEFRRESSGMSRVLNAIANPDLLVVSAFAIIGLLLALVLPGIPLD
jgi:hypothetical protein